MKYFMSEPFLYKKESTEKDKNIPYIIIFGSQ